MRLKLGRFINELLPEEQKVPNIDEVKHYCQLIIVDETERQLYSRIGFAHKYNLLSQEEMRFLLSHYWEQLGLNINPNDYTDAEAIATIARITNGNFRLLNRLFRQIKRIIEINNLNCITAEVVEAARECLVIGTI